MSLDLRGIRPSIEDLEWVVSDPDAAEGLVDAYLNDSRFNGRVSDLFAEVYFTRNETPFIILTEFFDDFSQPTLALSVGEEPLRMLGHIAENDLPYTDLVTADWTIVNEVLAEMWPLDYPAGDTGWQIARYTDNRPAVGMLSQNSMWWHYGSTESNTNRGRANAVTRILLCQDFLTRPLTFADDVVLSDFDAINTDPSCINCHANLDPMASHFFGFWWYERAIPDDNIYYHPEREQEWKTWTGIAPAYYGVPTDGLRDLGGHIASDPRYPECFVERSWELLTRREISIEDSDALTRHREVFLSEGLTIKSVFRSIVSDSDYRQVDDPDGTAKMMSAELLASSVEDLTGFRWTYKGWEMMRSQMEGFYNLAGGVDGDFVTESAREPSITLMLVQERLAEAAADFGVKREAFDGETHLFVELNDWTETSESHPEVIRRQIQHLHQRVLSRTLADGGDELEEYVSLWDELYAETGDPLRAWRGILIVLLRDPDFLIY
jgi:hypothetical protein